MDYSHLGLTYNLRALNNPAEKGQNIRTEFEFGNRISKINTSKVNLGEFIKRVIGGSALGTFNTSQALNLSSSITYNSPKGDNRTFGKPVVGIYQGAGTTAGSQIYPIRGTGVTLGRYDVIGGELDYSDYNGTSDQWRAMIVDTNGTSNQVVTFVADWIFADYVTDNVS